MVAADGSIVGLERRRSGRRTARRGRAAGWSTAAEELRPGRLQLEAATVAGSVFVVRDGDRLIAATTSPEPTVGLVFYDLKTCLRSIDAPEAEARAPQEEGRRCRGVRSSPAFLLAAGSLAGSVLVRRRAARKQAHVDLYAADGSMHSFADGTPEADRLLPLAHDLLAAS